MLPPLLIPEPEITPAMDQAIRDTLCLCFPNDAANFSVTRAWHGSRPAYSAVILEDGVVIAHAGAVQRTIQVGGRPVTIAGIQNVCVLPHRRGQGLAAEVLAALLAEAGHRGTDCGLLFCLPALEKVYAAMGWRTVAPRAVWATTTAGRRYELDGHNVVMSYPLGMGEFPVGVIDLQGDDW